MSCTDNIFETESKIGNVTILPYPIAITIWKLNMIQAYTNLKKMTAKNKHAKTK